MFEPTSKARVFAVSPGVDFAEALVDGLMRRMQSCVPEDLARVELYVNTARMQRRVRQQFQSKGSVLLPKIKLITDFSTAPTALDLPPAVNPLRRRLELCAFISKLIEREPELAPRSAIYDLSDSLATLMDEMHGEGVKPETLAALDVSDQSGHWERSLKFLRIITPFFEDNGAALDKEARQRQMIEGLTANWESSPPENPIIVAGSTGSRGATSLLMEATASLPQGAIVLPGFDNEMPKDVWERMADPASSEDHPQFRFQQLMGRLDLKANDVKVWSDHTPPDQKRNKLISLSLRPAPVTNQWLEEGPKLGDLIELTANLTLVEADSPRAEADAIALRLRYAAQQGQTATLISPDRMLTRQVTAALDRWDILPDDSAGTPLALSPPGRFLNQCADLLNGPLSTEQLLALLKHPLCHSDGKERGEHLRLTRELELFLRKTGVLHPGLDTLRQWAKQTAATAWLDWLNTVALTDHETPNRTLVDTLALHINLTKQLCAGPNSDGSGELWNEASGREALRICEELQEAADAIQLISTYDYISLFRSLLSKGSVRGQNDVYANIRILGTLEARVETADLTILGGMNEGSWPEAPPPDPWLNRAMRLQAGLLLPERKIGLSAHDYQQAIAAKQVVITRAKRTAEAETVPARWINRLCNLMTGLPNSNGPEALEKMKNRGDFWLSHAVSLTTPTERVKPAPRPSPAPPTTARPNQMSVTQIKTLIRDPFSIYAKKTLRLEPIDPLTLRPSAALRGIIIHRILERFISESQKPHGGDRFLQIAIEEFEKSCPWPTIRSLWLQRLEASIDQFLDDEKKRTENLDTQLVEVSGKLAVPLSGITLTCKADRIDLQTDGSVSIFDYKTGVLPTGPQQEKFDKQLLVEAAMMERGAFEATGKRQVKTAAFIGINAAMRTVSAPLDANPTDEVWSKLGTLFASWGQAHRGYTARLALFSKSDTTPYDHLSRFGEWDTNQAPQIETLQ